MTLWRSHEAAKATGGRATGDWSAQGVTLDSRAAQAGDLFVALKDQRDGHDFFAGGLAAGAAAGMVSPIAEGVAPGAWCYIKVAPLAAALPGRYAAPIVARFQVAR